jgi:hypothetical protein
MMGNNQAFLEYAEKHKKEWVKEVEEFAAINGMTYEEVLDRMELLGVRSRQEFKMKGCVKNGNN